MMVLTFNSDYTFSPLVRNVMDDGVLVGTRKYISYTPSKLREYTTRKITETNFSTDGQRMAEASQSLLQDENLTLDALYVLIEDWGNQERAIVLNIEK